MQRICVAFDIAERLARLNPAHLACGEHACTPVLWSLGEPTIGYCLSSLSFPLMGKVSSEG